mmetsp:Transcript_1945/g.4410  ORF Transcript_1945/g.4410 Transcript_1945/m.4410 type:complete len:951 (+) Transcript_1945:90-2942(+)
MSHPSMDDEALLLEADHSTAHHGSLELQTSTSGRAPVVFSASKCLLAGVVGALGVVGIVSATHRSSISPHTRLADATDTRLNTIITRFREETDQDVSGDYLQSIERHEYVSFGIDSACRLDRDDRTRDRRNSSKVVTAGTQKECSVMCDLAALAGSGCKGYEWHERSKRCELWSKPITWVKHGVKGNECVARVWAGKFQGIGSNVACRVNISDKVPRHKAFTKTIRPVPDASTCGTLCRTTLGITCAGVEFHARTGSCEMWHVNIGNSVRAAGYQCFRFHHAGLQPSFGKPLLLRSVLTNTCLGQDLKMKKCLFNEVLSDQHWQFVDGLLYRPLSSGDSCLNADAHGDLQLALCNRGSTRWHRDEQHKFHTEKPIIKAHSAAESDLCLSVGSGKAELRSCYGGSGQFKSYGRDSACRLNSWDTTVDGEGTVTAHTLESVDACKQLCMTLSSSDGCLGYEYRSNMQTGSCRIWKQRPGYVVAEADSECFRFEWSSTWESKGPSSVCRADADDTTDNGRGTTMQVRAASKQECAQKCEFASRPCFGYEWWQAHQTCELWTEYILHSKTLNGRECVARIWDDERIYEHPQQNSVLLHKVPGLANIDPEAKCTDGSEPAYYFRRATEPDKANLWFVYLQGGGWCSSERTCKARVSWWKDLVSSKGWRNTLDATGVFSDSAIQREESWYGSPLAGANLVYLRYCSSDAFMGDSTKWGFQFRGYRTVRAALKHLVQKQGFESTDTLVLGGFSAGARGAMAHLDTVREVLPTGANIVGFLDSPLYLEFNGFTKLASESSQATSAYVAKQLTEPCVGEFGEAGRWKCTFGQYRVPMLKENFMIIASQYDQYQLHLHRNDTSLQKTFALSTRKLLHSLGGNAAVYSSACFSHAVSTHFRFSQELVLASGAGSCLIHSGGPNHSPSSILNLSLAAFASGNSPPRVLETCSGLNCGVNCAT